MAEIRRHSGEHQPSEYFEHSESEYWEHFIQAVDEVSNRQPEEVSKLQAEEEKPEERPIVAEVLKMLPAEEQMTLVADAMGALSPTDREALLSDQRDRNLRSDASSQESTTRPASAETRRLNVVFSESAYNKVQELAKRSDRTVSEFVRDAVALQKWFDETRAEGWRILTEKRGRVREVLKLR